jgi:uncharacterized protein YndB with AHSA1/START domain
MNNLEHRLDRDIVIRAPRETVFRYFTDSDRWAQWWGKGSTIDARIGGRMYIKYPGEAEALGEVLEIAPPDRIVFSYGFVSGKPIPPGSSRVTISLAADGALTRLRLSHEFSDAAVRDEHVQGWRYQLSLFSNVVADEVNAHASTAVDAWFDAWAEPDDVKRNAAFTSIASADVSHHDRFSSIVSLPDLVAHSGAAQRFMPGVRLQRRGEVRHCQGIVLADWAMLMNGEEKGTGTNVFIFGPGGHIESVTGFYS